ncbi:MAG: polyprenyl synthetase family protein [Candidatus Aenigmatarchaeota archaeon]
MIEEVERMLKKKGKAIEKELEKAIPRKGTPNLNDAVWYHLNSGGKRVRPVLAILTCEALGCDTNKVMPFAAACELLHNWLLVHDDIEDGDRMRRDKPALWVKYGVAHGINVGDFMSLKVVDIVLNSQLDDAIKLSLFAEIAETCVKTAQGQTMDMNLRGQRSPSEKDYMKMIELKTAWYLTLPMVGGAIVAGRTGLVPKIKEFGMKVGPAFQIADDLLDLTEGKGRGEIGSDIKEGKRSIMVVHCSVKCSRDERKRMFEILDKPRENTTKGDIAYVKSLFEKHGSIEYARQKARSLVDESTQTTSSMPGELRSMLDDFARYLIERKK